jgi:hypothetical protein
MSLRCRELRRVRDSSQRLACLQGVYRVLIRAILVEALAVAVTLLALALFFAFIFPLAFATLVIIFAIRTVARLGSELEEERDEW